jgi:hypothetical protein
MKRYNDPFYFAVPHWMPTADRAQVPGHLKSEFGVEGRIEFVHADARMRLYRVAGHNG